MARILWHSMEDSATEFVGVSSIIIWLALMVVGSGLLGMTMILLLKNRVRRRMLGQMKAPSCSTPVVDAWSESAKRMDGQT